MTKYLNSPIHRGYLSTFHFDSPSQVLAQSSHAFGLLVITLQWPEEISEDQHWDFQPSFIYGWLIYLYSGLEETSQWFLGTFQLLVWTENPQLSTCTICDVLKMSKLSKRKLSLNWTLSIKKRILVTTSIWSGGKKFFFYAIIREIFENETLSFPGALTNILFSHSSNRESAPDRKL